MLFDARGGPDGTGQVINLRQATMPQARLKMNTRWLVVEVPPDASDPSSMGAVALYDLDDLGDPPRPVRRLCDEPGARGYIVPSLSDSIVPCTVNSNPYDDPYADLYWEPEFPGDTYVFGDAYLLHVFLPATGERDLGLALSSPFDAHVFEDTLAAGVAEKAQHEDLDGDGVIGEKGIQPSGWLGGPYVLHEFNARTAEPPVNLRADVISPRYPLLRLGDPVINAGDALVIITPDDLLSTSGRAGKTFWDLDGDGTYEELPDVPPAPVCDGPPDPTAPGADDGACPAPPIAAGSTSTTVPLLATHTGCISAAQCSDGDPCTTDACVEGECVFTHFGGRSGSDCELAQLRAPLPCGSTRSGRLLRVAVRRDARRARRLLERCAVDRFERRLDAVAMRIERSAEQGRITESCRAALARHIALSRDSLGGTCP